MSFFFYTFCVFFFFGLRNDFLQYLLLACLFIFTSFLLFIVPRFPVIHFSHAIELNNLWLFKWLSCFHLWLFKCNESAFTWFFFKQFLTVQVFSLACHPPTPTPPKQRFFLMCEIYTWFIWLRIWFDSPVWLIDLSVGLNQYHGRSIDSLMCRIDSLLCWIDSLQCWVVCQLIQ